MKIGSVLFSQKKRRSFVFTFSHYSKSQILVQKFKFDKTPTFSRVFHPNFFFWQFFSWNQSCQQLKKVPNHNIFTSFSPKKSTIFTGNQSWIYGQKMKISNSVCFKVFLFFFVVISAIFPSYTYLDVFWLSTLMTSNRGEN